MGKRELLSRYEDGRPIRILKDLDHAGITGSLKHTGALGNIT